MKKWIALLLCALLICSCTALADETMDETKIVPTLDEEVDAVFRGVKAVGAAFLVAKDGEVVYERYYGVQQKTTGVPVTEDTYFKCASVTKLVTGIGLMKMMDEGMLAPDEDISKYLGYTVRNPRYPDTPITLRMLMSHTAGLSESNSYNKKTSLLQDMIDVEHKARTNFKNVKPGTEYTYSNFGAGITGSIVESVTGQDVSSFMRGFLFEPLGIDAAYHISQIEDYDDVAATYKKDGKLYNAPSYWLKQGYVEEALPDEHYRVTVGSLLIRPRDLMKLGIALCGDGTVDGVRVLSEDAIAMMRQEQSFETTGITPDSPYTFFTIRQNTLFEGRTVYGHQGTDQGIVCNLYTEPVSGLTIVVMCNGCNTIRDDGIMRMTRRLAALAAREYME